MAPNKNVDTWKRNIAENLSLWSDLESHIEELANDLQEEKCPAFLDFLDNLTEELSNYLDQENEKLTSLDNEYNDYLRNGFYRGIMHIEGVAEELITPLISTASNRRRATRTIINFNYTDSIEKLYTTRSGNRTNAYNIPIIHPHGDLRTSLVIGVSNLYYTASEIQGPGDVQREEMRRWLIKKNILTNMRDLEVRYNHAKEAIRTSDVICIYGMSIGKSDSLWWEEIAEWLALDYNRKLIIFAHSVNQNSGSQVPRRQYVYRGEPIKDRFFENTENVFSAHKNESQISLEKIRDNIIVRPTAGIFNININNLSKTAIKELAPV